VHDPFTGKILAEVSQGSEADAEDAIRSAAAATQPMGALPAHARFHLLQRIAGAIYDRRDEFARVMTGEAGKPISDARREVARAVQTFTIAAEEAKRIPGEVIPLDWTPGMDSHVGILRRVPIGPVLGITPFNFPLNLVGAPNSYDCPAVG
jgi:glyceraldehyde-3-phosphate dehydrogenase (NADP+)